MNKTKLKKIGDTLSPSERRYPSEFHCSLYYSAYKWCKISNIFFIILHNNMSYG